MIIEKVTRMIEEAMDNPDDFSAYKVALEIDRLYRDMNELCELIP